MGDYSSIRASACPSRSSVSALGDCHAFTYSLAPDAGEGLGWAGVVWQYPVNNWGSQAGYDIPAGARTVSFYARGDTGTEILDFSAGGAGSATTACQDTFTSDIGDVLLSTSWAKITIPIGGAYPPGVLFPFAWTAVASGQTAGATEITFYIDDIRWTM
jgi:hypothetical protein